MLDLVWKLARKKFLKPDEEDPVREYMRLELELEEICSPHAINLIEMKQMNRFELTSSFSAEETKQIDEHLLRMRQLWLILPASERQYLSSPDQSSTRRELVDFDELAEDFREKEYLVLHKELECCAQVQYMGVREVVGMESRKLVQLFGKEEAAKIHGQRLRLKELWEGFNSEQRDRYLLQSLNY